MSTPVKTAAIVVATPLDIELLARAERLAKRPRAKATVRAYTRNWAAWEEFCTAHGFSKMPAREGDIVAYLATLHGAGHPHSTIALAYAAIRAKHLDEGEPLPTLEKVRNVLHNVARESGKAPRSKAPLMVERLKQLARDYLGDAEDESLPRGRRTLAVRDAALILLGFGAARRRSEVVALDYADVAFEEDGLRLRIARSKTDQSGEGLVVGVARGSSRATCPARALRRWLDYAEITEGPIFRGVDRAGRVLAERLSDQGVARAVKRAAKRLGLTVADFAGHSLRSGFATSASAAGKNTPSIMRQGGWKSDRIVREKYIKPGSVFVDNASEDLL